MSKRQKERRFDWLMRANTTRHVDGEDIEDGEAARPVMGGGAHLPPVRVVRLDKPIRASGA